MAGLSQDGAPQNIDWVDDDFLREACKSTLLCPKSMGVSGAAVSLAISKSSVAWPSRQWWMEAIVHDILAQGFGTLSEKRHVGEASRARNGIQASRIHRAVGAVVSVPP